jgi:hypothetical protein
MTDEQFEDFLKTTLRRDAIPADDAAVQRVLSRLGGPLPRQKQPLWRLPSVLLNWDFAPAWPRMAALACCAALGFVRLNGSVLSSSRDIGSFVSEPDSLTEEEP